MTTRTEFYKTYDVLREVYLRTFGEEAPFYMPIEIPDAIEEMKEALESGITLDTVPDGVVS